MGEESKARVIARQSHHPVIADLIRNPEGQGRVAVILASRQYPQGGDKPNQPLTVIPA